MAKSLLDIFNSSDKGSQIDKNKTKTPLTKDKISNERELEEARKGIISTTKYSATPRG